MLSIHLPIFFTFVNLFICLHIYLFDIWYKINGLRNSVIQYIIDSELECFMSVTWTHLKFGIFKIDIKNKASSSHLIMNYDWMLNFLNNKMNQWLIISHWWLASMDCCSSRWLWVSPRWQAALCWKAWKTGKLQKLWWLVLFKHIYHLCFRKGIWNDMWDGMPKAFPVYLFPLHMIVTSYQYKEL